MPWKQGVMVGHAHERVGSFKPRLAFASATLSSPESRPVYGDCCGVLPLCQEGLTSVMMTGNRDSSPSVPPPCTCTCGAKLVPAGQPNAGVLALARGS
eukprot:724110-Prymnesium_polylepis.3